MEHPIGTRHAAIAAAALLACTAAVCTAADGEDYLFLGIHGIAGDSKTLAHYGMGGSAGYGARFGDHLWGEARLFGNVMHARNSGTQDFSQEGLGLDLLFDVAGSARSQWFVLAGAGGAYNDASPDTLDGGSFFYNAGAGWRARPSADSTARYRFEGRLIGDTFESGQTYGLVSFLVEFGPHAPAPAAAAPPPAPMNIVNLDPPPVVIADADGDGIADSDDKCSSTLKGAKVERDGCVWQDQVVTMSNLRFTVGSNHVTRDSRQLLDGVVQFIRNQPDVVMDVYGHTDSKGSDALNLKLSKERAAAVCAYLVGKGIAKSRLKSDGFGESQPIADNATEAGRARNRRVDLHIHSRAPH